MILAVLALSSVLLAVPTPTENCLALVAAQNEQIALLETQVAMLKEAIENRKKAEMSRMAEIDGLNMTVDTYKKLWLAEAEFTAMEKRRNVWTERLIAFKWGLVGFGGGILVERFAE